MFPVGIYLVKVNNRNTRTRCKIMFKVNNKDTRTTPTAYFTLSRFSVSIVSFEHVIAGWKGLKILKTRKPITFNKL